MDGLPNEVTKGTNQSHKKAQTNLRTEETAENDDLCLFLMQ